MQMQNDEQREHFKMRAGTKAAVAAGALGVASSGGGGGIVTNCPPDDKSWYCKLSRAVNGVQMVLYLIALLVGVAAVVYFVAQWLRRGKR